jgi:hypothetical protein
MGISSKDLVPRSDGTPVSKGLVRSFARREEQLQQRAALRARQREYDAALHLHFTYLVVETASADTNEVADFVSEMQEVVGGDPARASVVAPFVNDVVGIVHADFRRTFVG